MCLGTKTPNFCIYSLTFFAAISNASRHTKSIARAKYYALTEPSTIASLSLMVSKNFIWQVSVWRHFLQQRNMPLVSDKKHIRSKFRSLCFIRNLLYIFTLMCRRFFHDLLVIPLWYCIAICRFLKWIIKCFKVSNTLPYILLDTVKKI